MAKTRGMLWIILSTVTILTVGCEPLPIINPNGQDYAVACNDELQRCMVSDVSSGEEIYYGIQENLDRVIFRNKKYRTNRQSIVFEDYGRDGVVDYIKVNEFVFVRGKATKKHSLDDINAFFEAADRRLEALKEKYGITDLATRMVWSEPNKLPLEFKP